jgi:hypothetical protein
MNIRIRIVKAPPSTIASDSIREAWVGVEMPAMSDKDESESWSSAENVGGYVVTGNDAVEALLASGKDEAASFWSTPIPPSKLRFAVDCCEVVE